MFPLAVAERPIDKCQDQLSDISRVREKRLSFRNFSLITSRHTHTHTHNLWQIVTFRDSANRDEIQFEDEIVGEEINKLKEKKKKNTLYISFHTFSREHLKKNYFQAESK